MGLVGIFAMAAGLCAALWGQAQAAEGVVKVGLLAPLSGFAAPDGQNTLSACEIARDELNAAGGILGKKVELVVYDDRADPKEAVNFARRLVELDKCAFVIGGSYSAASVAASPVVTEAGVPFMCAYAIATDVTKGRPLAFRMGVVGTVQGRVGAWLAKEMGARKVAVLTVQNDFGKSLEAGFREQAGKYGIGIPFAETYAPGNKNFTPLLMRVKEAAPDALYAVAYFTEAAALARQARAAGLTLPIIGCDGYDSPKFIELAGKDAEGIIFTTTLDRDGESPELRAFLAKMLEKTGGYGANMDGASGYAAMKIMARAAERAGSLDGPALASAIRGMRDVDTVVGRVFRWNEMGDPVKEASVQVVLGGVFRRHARVTDLSILAP